MSTTHIFFLQRYHVLIFLLAASLFFCLPLSAATKLDEYDSTVGFSLKNFGYKEFIGREVVDREDGVIPGIVLGLGVSGGNWRIASDFYYNVGDVDYVGQTQSGIPATTKTRAEIVDMTAQVEYWRGGALTGKSVVYAGGGYHYWGRDIKSGRDINGSPVSGLFEIYEWWHGFVGAKGDIVRSGKHRWGADFRVSRTISPTMKVDMGSFGLVGVGWQTFDLGPKLTWRLSLPWRYRLDERTVVFIDPYTEYWKLGQSPVIFGFFEPYSETVNYGVNIGVNSRF